MPSLNFLYYSLGIGFLILVGFLSWSAFNLSVSLKRLTSILIKVDDMAKDAEDLKNFIKNGIIYLSSLFIKKPEAPVGPKAKRGGEVNGK